MQPSIFRGKLLVSGRVYKLQKIIIPGDSSRDLFIPQEPFQRGHIFTHHPQKGHELAEVFAFFPLDIQGHLLRFGMTGPPKYADQTPNSPQEVFAGVMSRVHDWLTHCVRFSSTEARVGTINMARPGELRLVRFVSRK